MPSVQRVQWARFRVAAVGVVGLVILGTLLWLLTGGTLFEEKATLYLYVPDATGIGPDSPVEVDGITVGKVVDVHLSGSRDPRRVVRVTISIQRSSLQSIPAESYAQLSVSSPVGDKFVDITSAGTGLRRPNTEITYKEEPDLFKALDLTGFEQQLRDLDAVLTEIETGRSRVGQFVLGHQMYDDLRRRFREMEQDVRDAASTTSAVGQALYTDRVYQRMLAPVRALDERLAKLQSGQGAGGRLLRDNAQYEQVRAGVGDLRRSLESARGGAFFQSDQMYSDWNRSLAALIRTVEQVNTDPMFTTSQFYDNLNGVASEMEKSVRDFRQDPRKYLRLKLF